MRWTLATLITVVAAAALAACGDSTPGHTPVTPASNFSSPADGIAFRAPKGATVDKGKNEQVAVLRRGEATLVVSQLLRNEKLPDSKRELERAANALKDEYTRLSTAPFQSATSTVPNGEPEASVTLSEGEDSDKISVTAEHVHHYEFGNEFVVDMVAPHPDFERAKSTLFDAVVASLKITKPQD